MNSDQRIFLIGLYLNSALYLSACAVIGFATGNGIAWKCAVAAMGFAYIGYYGGVDGRVPRWLGNTGSLGSIALGAVSGLLLLFAK